ncbi:MULTISPECIES: peptidoglycan-associated lipoprotein Pal [Tatumella]|uniref:Peptidoglycan-associated lipoprotein n=1 Tax=Tatumella punctata TaxID=399969 RepID=A0ABW1VPZ8_9GAMM|nr:MULTISPECIES: peptidoglycan-associated lipoprotein Pal [unclassified Tatumella]MBS0854632.1 peptidoglycan-associated lipoprotein Pal [Tatumella sp. JGM16]MBS0875901.1 peptidoglycan-associated lipoprotein Pal [Tatumella sp. JGM82]MBS0890306.1 peptidoglycan-associated lipoprotein Pal [Tatumella sp. JGM94]MBS0892587.1 peptidoglycan-associated lipoprotein Pal [Tatumella sp. JGM130]MBS0900432.1 peptidoglycan-associated lipoprotein Pal [Tatumella sp. JGM100]
MQLNKLLKGLMLALPVLAVAACSSHKNDNDSGATTGADSAYGNGANSGNMSSDEQARLQMQQLQQNNIVYFGLDKYDILPDYAQMLDQHANFLRSNPSYKVTIEGHADERGTPEYNIALGERRANAVKMYLQGKGVAEDQMSIVSYGKEKPAVLGHDEAAWAKNRRAVLVY